MKRQSSFCIVATAALALIVSAAAADDSLSYEAKKFWQFDVYLDDKPIGFHRFDVKPAEERTILETRAEFDVKFLFVTAFRYRHETREVWEGGCLEKIDARTDNNGEVLNVSGSETPDDFELDSKKGPPTIDGCVQSFAYWNPDILDAKRLLNAQTGEYEDVTVTEIGEEEITVAGEQVKALRYKLSVSRGDIHLWYRSDDKTWVALDAPAKGDRRLRYQAQQIPDIDDARKLVAGAT